MSAIDHNALEIERLNHHFATVQLNNAISLLRTTGCLSLEEAEELSLRATAYVTTSKRLGAFKPKKDTTP